MLLAFLTQQMESAGGADSGDPRQNLYTAETIITGTLEVEKRRGFAECLQQVLVKVSGDTSLTRSTAAKALGARAADLVETYHLRDRMAGIPVHDEQGTRERPHVLTVTFSRHEVNEALRQLGGRPWLDRPAIVLAVGVDNGTKRFVLVRDSVLGVDQRDSLVEIGQRFGLQVDFPDSVTLAAFRLDHGALRKANPERLQAMARSVGGGVVLSGTLIWDEAALKWTSEWRLAAFGRQVQWGSTGTSFDADFRTALEKTLEALAGKARE